MTAARPFSRIAVVNRGEPAMRLIRAVRELNRERPALTTIALYTDADEHALFVREADEAVRLGHAGQDYVDLELLERVLPQVRADAAWVGWGFVAERPEFAELCERLGIVFIGPSADTMRRLGDKIASKRLADELGLPVAPWSGGPVGGPADALALAQRIGYPLLVKASAGGGGRGLRRVDRPEDLAPALASAAGEAREAFGDATLFMERLIERVRHVEVQVAADGCGGVWALGVRDCTIQRRHQKIIEESGSTALDAGAQASLEAAAARLCGAVDYRGVATVEFLLDPASGETSFMEVNARLQVEHPVTEAVTGADLVKLQLHLAAGGRLEGRPPAAAGHAIEARLCAEDPEAGFAPAPGVIEVLRLPGGPGIRVDTGVVEGDTIPPDFDSMIAKVIAWGRDRREALDRLARALGETVAVVRGGTTNRSFLLRLLERPEIRRGTADVAWLERARVEDEDASEDGARLALLLAAVEVAEDELRVEQARFFASAARGRPEATGAASRTVELSLGEQAYRLHVYALGSEEYRVTGEGGCAELRVERPSRFERRLVHRNRSHRVLVVPRGAEQLVEIDGATCRLRSGDAGMVRAPSPGVVASVLARVGEHVAAGTAVVVLEAMKMESAVLAPVSGTVSRVLVGAAVQVAAGAPLVQIAPVREAGRRSAARVSLRGSDDGCGEPGEAARAAGLALLRRLMLGFDADAGEVRRALTAHAIPGPAGEAERALEDSVLRVFADVCALSRRRPHEPERWGEQAHSARDHFFDYLRSPDARGRGLPDTFLVELRRALAHYGVTGLERTPALDQALFRIFKAHLRVEQQLPAVVAILERRAAEDPTAPPPGDDLRELIDRLVAATEHRYPAVADLAREVRHRSFDRPAFERARAAVYAEMEGHLACLAADPDAGDRADRMLRLVDCPQPMQTFLCGLAQSASPGSRRLMLEVLIRRYYRTRSLEEVGTLDAHGRTWGTARYREGDRWVRVLNSLAGMDDLAAATRDAATALRSMAAGEEAVVDLHLWAEEPPGPDVLEPAMRAAVQDAGLPDRAARVLVSVSGPGPEGAVSRSHHLTFRRMGGGFEEDRAVRGLHPMMAERLDLWRLSNFRIERLPSVEDVYLFRGVARENPADERLFAIAEVRDVTPERDGSGRIVALPHLERMFLEAVAGIRQFQARRPPAQRLQWNRVMLHVWPLLEACPDDIRTIVNRLAPATEDLGMEKTVVRVRLVEPGASEVRDVVLHLANPLGAGVMLMRYDTPADRPIQPLSEYRQKVVQMRRRGLVHPSEIIGLLAPAGDGPVAGLPPGQFVEHDLDGEGRLTPVERPQGRHTANLVVGLIRNRTAKHPEGMARVIILGDPSRSLGALAEPECRRIIAALSLAERMGVPVEWFALSSGARISMDSGTENMDWIAAVLRRLVEFTQAGGEVNVIVTGVNVGAQPYWNAEATMLMHTRGILVMTPDAAMVLTGKQALDYSGGVSAEDNYGIGGYEQVMGPNGQAQYYASDLTAACRLLLRHYEHTYRPPGERFPRPAVTADPRDRDVRIEAHTVHPGGPAHVGDIFSDDRNPDRKRAFDIRSVMAAVVDHDVEPMERWLGMAGAETAVTWDAHLGGHPVCLIGFESRPLARHGALPADGPSQWTAGTLFPLSSKKVARAINAASDNRPVVVLANLSGFDGSPESMRGLQLEFGAEIGRAVVNFRGPIVFCVISRYHGGAFVVFSNRLNQDLEVAALEGSRASVIGGAPAAAVVFAREVERRARADDRVQDLERRLSEAGSAERPALRARLLTLMEDVTAEKRGEVAREFDSVHSVRRALEVGSVHTIVSARRLRPYLIDAVERGMRRALARQ